MENEQKFMIGSGLHSVNTVIHQTHLCFSHQLMESLFKTDGDAVDLMESSICLVRSAEKGEPHSSV